MTRRDGKTFIVHKGTLSRRINRFGEYDDERKRVYVGKGTNDDTTGANGKWMIFGYPLLAMLYLLLLLDHTIGVQNTDVKSKSILYPRLDEARQRCDCQCAL